MKVIEHINQAKDTLISFEILPPLKGKGIQSLYQHPYPLMEFKPAYINVTYHRSEHVFKKTSDGNFQKVVVRKRPGTESICAAIMNKYSVDTVPHLICGGFGINETEDALAANDASSKGIYKGVMIGSTGTIVFNLTNSGTTITAVMVIDGVTVNLTSAVSIVAGQTYVAPFTGTLSGSSVSITFSVSAIGANPTVTTSSIPGHPNSSFVIVKENSASLIECFEGTYHSTKPEDGVLNFILSRTLSNWYGFARQNGTNTSGTAGSGTIANNKLIDPTQNNQSIGTLSGDNLDGTFLDGNGRTITIVCKRTL